VAHHQAADVASGTLGCSPAGPLRTTPATSIPTSCRPTRNVARTRTRWVCLATPATRGTSATWSTRSRPAPHQLVRWTPGATPTTGAACGPRSPNRTATWRRTRITRTVCSGSCPRRPAAANSSRRTRCTTTRRRPLPGRRKVLKANSSEYLDQASNYTYTPARQLAAVTKTGVDKGDNETYEYDAAGNTTKQTIGATTSTMTYDRNRLVKTVTGTTTLNQRYDPFGRATTTDVGAPGRGAERLRRLRPPHPPTEIRFDRHRDLHPQPDLRPLRPRHQPIRKSRHRRIDQHPLHLCRPRQPSHSRGRARHHRHLENLQVLRLRRQRREPFPGRLPGQRHHLEEVVLRHQPARRRRNPHRRHHRHHHIDLPLHRLRPAGQGRHHRRRRDQGRRRPKTPTSSTPTASTPPATTAPPAPTTWASANTTPA
jgi:hypothetical protein